VNPYNRRNQTNFKNRISTLMKLSNIIKNYKVLF
jgi:hypothetical protein